MTFNKKVIYVLITMLVLFCGLVCYFSYFQIFKGPELANSGNNPRTLAKEQSIKRGSFYDRNGECLAYSEMQDGTQTRVYPFNRLYSQLIGYSHSRFGRTLLENTQNGYLLGSYNQGVLDALVGNRATEGASVHLTIDNDLQLLASDLLGNRNGAIVAVKPRTGEVLTSLAKPWYNPNTLSADWQSLNQQEGIFLPRDTGGLYPPGSIFKVITAASMVENGLTNETYNDTGSAIIKGQEVNNYDKHVYGQLDIDSAFLKSSNIYFAQMADKLGTDKLQKTAEAFYFNKTIPYDISVKKSTLLANTSTANLISVGYGQGDVLTSPMHMALVAATIANDGVMMQPFVVDRAVSPEGEVLLDASPSVLSRAVSAATAERVTEMMEACVQSGTGTGARISGIKVAGKTGTAEVDGKKDHAWFIAFAPADNPEIAVSILLENAGTTGSACAGMAAKLIRAYLG